MMISRALTIALPSLLLALALLQGCRKDQPAAPDAGEAGTGAVHDPDDVPITEADVEKPADYESAASRIESYRDTIRDEIAAGRPSKSHRALDEADIVLNWLPEIARDSGVPKDQWEAVNTTAQTVRELLNRVHANIDAGQEPDYAAVSEDLDQAIAELKAIQAESNGETR
jgi:hypothetical protein